MLINNNDLENSLIWLGKFYLKLLVTVSQNFWYQPYVAQDKKTAQSLLKRTINLSINLISIVIIMIFAIKESLSSEAA